ncbi:ribosome-binding factor A [Bradyrhizobium sp. AZCC 1588]
MSATSSNVIAWRRSSALCKSKSYEELGIFELNRHAPPGAQLRPGMGHPVVTATNVEHGIRHHPLSRVMTAIGISTMPRHHSKGSAPGGSQRQLRVGETVRHAVADILSHGNVHDPDLEGHIITVPEVRMSPDLKLATIYVMPLGGRDTDVVIAALERNKKFLRGEIAHRVNLKFAPDLRFRVDERFDEAERIEKLLRTPAVQRDLAPDSDDK